MTDTVELQKQRKRQKRAEAQREAFEDGLLEDLKSTDASSRKAALKIYNDRALERVEVLQAELDELKKAAGDKSELASLTAANAVLAVEIERMKSEGAAAVNAEIRKVHDSVRDERAALSQKEAIFKRTEAVFKANANETLNKLAFDFLGSLVRRMPSWEPKDFFDPDIPKSPAVWKIWPQWQDRADSWCLWELQLAAISREKQVAWIAAELHTYSCINCQRGRHSFELTPQRRTFLEERMKHMHCENEVFDIIREKTDYCREQPYPLMSTRFAYGDRQQPDKPKKATVELPSYL